MPTFKEDTEMFDRILKNSVKCECGHTIYIKKDKRICSWCGKLNYKYKKYEFQDKLLKAKIKANNKQNNKKV